MQVIEKLSITVEQYIEHSYHKQVRAPLRCLNCLLHETLKRLGYYDRYTSDEEGKNVRFRVARFRCERCRRTTSCLPSFALTYRAIATRTVARFLAGGHKEQDVRRWAYLLEHYLQRYRQKYQWLRELVGSRFGRGPPGEDATAFLRRAVAACGSLAELTIVLTLEFKATCFGTYCCHQPTCPN